MPQADLLIHSAAWLLTMAGHSARPKRGAELADLGAVADGAVAALNGMITAVGSTGQVRAEVNLLPQARVLVPTFMGAHAFPPAYRGREEEYVDLVAAEVIPRVAEEKLARYCDVFCDEGVFTVDQAWRILKAGKRHGLLPKIHADELVSSGGAELAAEVGAVSADHLLKVSPAGINALVEAGVIAVLLPGTAFFLNEEYAPAREMIDRGVAVALSTDRNPGSSPTEATHLILTLACLKMKMMPAEALCAATINAAHAVGLAHRVGSLEKGKQADILVIDAPDGDYIPYHYGTNLVEAVYKKGAKIV